MILCRTDQDHHQFSFIIVAINKWSYTITQWCLMEPLFMILCLFVGIQKSNFKRVNRKDAFILSESENFTKQIKLSAIISGSDIAFTFVFAQWT